MLFVLAAFFSLLIPALAEQCCPWPKSLATLDYETFDRDGKKCYIFTQTYVVEYITVHATPTEPVLPLGGKLIDHNQQAPTVTSDEPTTTVTMTTRMTKTVTV